jgi:hypothetical protein
MSKIVEPPAAEMNIVPIPIRSNVVVKIQVPPDPTAAEAEKVARVVRAFGQEGGTNE